MLTMIEECIWLKNYAAVIFMYYQAWAETETYRKCVTIVVLQVEVDALSDKFVRVYFVVYVWKIRYNC